MLLYNKILFINQFISKFPHFFLTWKKFHFPDFFPDRGNPGSSSWCCGLVWGLWLWYFLGEYSAILSTFIKLPFVIKTLFCLFMSGHFTQVLLYAKMCEEYLRSVGGTFSLSSLSFRGKGLPYIVMRSISLLSPSTTLCVSQSTRISVKRM